MHSTPKNEKKIFIDDIQAKERIRELERELEILQQKLAEQEDKSNKLYLHMYSKDQEQAGPSTSAALPPPARISVPELLHQLQVTQDELENLRVSFGFIFLF